MNKKAVIKLMLLPFALGALAENGSANTLKIVPTNFFASGVCPKIGTNWYHIYHATNVSGFTTPLIKDDCSIGYDIPDTNLSKTAFTLTVPANPTNQLTVTAQIDSRSYHPLTSSATYTTPGAGQCLFWVPGKQPGSGGFSIKGTGSISVGYSCGGTVGYPISFSSHATGLLPGIQLGKAPFNQVLVTDVNNDTKTYTIDADGNIDLSYADMKVAKTAQFNCNVNGVQVCTPAAAVPLDVTGTTLDFTPINVGLSLPTGTALPGSLNLTDATPLLDVSGKYYPLSWATTQVLPRATKAKSKLKLKTSVVSAKVNVPVAYSVAGGATINAYCDTGATDATGCLASTSTTNYWVNVPSTDSEFPKVPLTIATNNTDTGPFSEDTAFNLFSDAQCTTSILDPVSGAAGSAFHYDSLLLTPKSEQQALYLGYSMPATGRKGVCSAGSNLATLNGGTAQFTPIKMKINDVTIDPSIYNYCGGNASLYYQAGDQWIGVPLSTTPKEIEFVGEAAPLSVPGMQLFLSCQPQASAQYNGGCPNNMLNQGGVAYTEATPQTASGETTIAAPVCSGNYAVFPVRYCTNATTTNLGIYSDADCKTPITDAVVRGSAPDQLVVAFPQNNVPQTVYTGCGDPSSAQGCSCVPTTSLNAANPASTPLDCSSNTITMFVNGYDNSHVPHLTENVAADPNLAKATTMSGSWPSYSAPVTTMDSYDNPTTLQIDMTKVPAKDYATRSITYYSIYDPDPVKQAAGWTWFYPTAAGPYPAVKHFWLIDGFGKVPSTNLWGITYAEDTVNQKH